MRIRFALAAALLAAPAAAQTTYYVAATGSDANSGTAPGGAWQTLARASTLALGPGDQLLLRRGDTFAGPLVLAGAQGSAGAPVVVGDYGAPADPLPVVSGAAAVTGWQAQGGNRWTATCPAAGAAVTGLYAAGRPLPLGRTPNADAPRGGYLTVDGHVGQTQLTAADLPAGPNWTGAEVVARTKHWILDRLLVTGQPGPTTLALQLVGTSSYAPQDGWGYFLQNHPATLDRPGEWCYRAAGQQLTLYSAADPNGLAVTATVTPQAVAVTNCRYLTVQNLVLARTLTDALLVRASSDLTVQGCQVRGAGGNGFTFTGTGRGVRLLNNVFEDVSNTALEMPGDPYAFGGPERYADVRVAGNTFRRTATARGRSRSGDNQGFGLNLRADDLTVQDNAVDSCGYMGLTFKGNRVLVQHNTVTHFCLVRDDGGGIYSYNGDLTDQSTGRVVRENLVRYGPGDPNGAADAGGRGDAHGIYLDDYTPQVTVQGNVVADCAAAGILLHNPYAGQVVTGNTVFNCDKAQLLIDADHPDPANLGLVVQDNVWYAARADQPAAGFYLKHTDLRTFGQFDRNVYASPFGDADRLRLNLDDVGHAPPAPVYETISLPQWQRLNPGAYDPAATLGPPAQVPYALGTVGAGRMCNGGGATFDAGNDCYTPFVAGGGGGAVTWDAASPLDGGALRLAPATAANPNGLPFGAHLGLRPYTGAGALAAGQTLVLRFDAVAARDGQKLTAFLYDPATGQPVVARPQSVAVQAQRQRYELAFVATAAVANAQLTLQIEQDGQTLWLDNLTLQEAALTPLDPAQYLTLFTNPAATPRTVALPAGTYLDAHNATYRGTLTLAPYAAAVLLRTSGSGPLPVELTRFDAAPAGPAAVRLTWRTASERNCARFEVERSADGRAFAKVAETAGQGTTALPTAYAVLDPLAGPLPVRLLYYRLRQVDRDGAATYSPVRAVALGPSSSPVLYPNPTAGPAWLDLTGWAPGPHRFAVLDATGRRVLDLTLPGGYPAALDLSALPAGLYLLRGAGLALRMAKEAVER